MEVLLELKEISKYDPSLGCHCCGIIYLFIFFWTHVMLNPSLGTACFKSKLLFLTLRGSLFNSMRDYIQHKNTPVKPFITFQCRKISNPLVMILSCHLK